MRKQPEPFNPEVAQRELSKALADLTQTIEPMIEAAEGQRKKLEERGWSPTAAETIALQMLQGLMSGMFGGNR